jgi:glycosyltransferase involved in cell wall biosynthesis
VLVLNWRDTLNPEGGGSEVYVERMAAELVGHGFRATVFCAAHAEAPAAETKDSGVRMVRRGGRHTVYLRAALAYVTGAMGFGPLSRRTLGRPDAIVDVGNGLPFLSALYARKPVIALVHHVHREQWPVVLGRWGAKVGWFIESRLAVRVYRRCRYVTVSEATKAELVALGVEAERVSVIHNGTPEMPATAVSRSADPQLLVLGRLVPHKRVEIALRTVAVLRHELPALRLTVAGHGWWDYRLRELAGELGIADRVSFTGFVSDEAKHRLLSQAWVALTPSLKEGWGLTIVEAGARGTPTVAFAEAGGVAEALVDGVTGLLADDEPHFVELTRRLLVDRPGRERMGAAAIAHAGSFTWTRSGERFAALLSPATVPRQRRSEPVAVTR